MYASVLFQLILRGINEGVELTPKIVIHIGWSWICLKNHLYQARNHPLPKEPA
jgi:hypothetical protein